MKLEVTQLSFVVHLNTWDRLSAAFFSDLEIPLADIQEVIIDPPECGYGFSLNGLRVGTHVPYVMVYGIVYHMKAKRDFMFFKSKNRSRVLKIMLKDETDASQVYKSLIIEVPYEQGTAEDWKKSIETSLK